MDTENRVQRRRRRTPETLRREVIDAAREILVVEGPGAITLQSLATALGMAHGNLTHHFGSAFNIQAALAEALISELLAMVRGGVTRLRAGAIDEVALVTLVFDTFEKTGVGQLLAWLSIHRSRNIAKLYDKFSELADDLTSDSVSRSDISGKELSGIILSVIIPALGAALIGSSMTRALNLPSSYLRDQIAAELAQQRSIRLVENKSL